MDEFSSDVGDEHVERSDPFKGTAFIHRLERHSCKVDESAGLADETLDGWWDQKHAQDVERTAPKIAEYGSHGSGSGDIDLMAQCFKMLRPDLTDDVCVELALAFYLQGKVARIFSSLSRNRPANEDSWFDARIYTIMAQSIRERGHWG